VVILDAWRCIIVGVMVRREKALDFSGRNSSPQTGSLHHPVACTFSAPSLFATIVMELSENSA
jgi:hypothetical protein